MLEFGFPVAIGPSHGGLGYGFPRWITLAVVVVNTGVMAYAKVNGVWTLCQIYGKVGGAWVPARMYAKSGGAWLPS